MGASRPRRAAGVYWYVIRLVQDTSNHSLMANIGSVFLGDVQRNRLRSSGSTPGSTPPSSPPPTSLPSRGAIHSLPTPTSDSAFPGSVHSQEKFIPPPHLAPTQSLELRVRWLEAILYGAKHDELLAGLRDRQPELRRGETLIRAAEHAQRRMNEIASAYDVLRRFFGHCESFPSLFPVLQPNLQ